MKSRISLYYGVETGKGDKSFLSYYSFGKTYLDMVEYVPTSIFKITILRFRRFIATFYRSVNGIDSKEYIDRTFFSFRQPTMILKKAHNRFYAENNNFLTQVEATHIFVEPENCIIKSSFGTLSGYDNHIIKRQRQHKTLTRFKEILLNTFHAFTCRRTAECVTTAQTLMPTPVPTVVFDPDVQRLHRRNYGKYSE